MSMTRRDTRSYGKGFGEVTIEDLQNLPLSRYVQQLPMAIADAQILPALTASVPDGWIATAQKYSMAIYVGSVVLLVLALAGGRR